MHNLYKNVSGIFCDNLPIIVPNPSRESIFNHVMTYVDPDGMGFLDGGDILPDDGTLKERNRQVEGVTFLPGAREGALINHGNLSIDYDAVEEIRLTAHAFGTSSKVEDLKKFYALLIREEMVSVINGLMSEFLDFTDEQLDALIKVSLQFLYMSPDRGPVKFALALLGQTDSVELIDDIVLIGRHEEFTTYSAVAVEKMVDQPEPILFSLIQQVEGWGRIELIKHLSGWDNQEYRNWLIGGGFRNIVLDEYLTYTAATEGNLLAVLRASPLEESEMSNVCEIVCGLIRGGVDEYDITNYQDGAQVIELYLSALFYHQISMPHFISLIIIRDFLDEIDINWSERLEYGWTPYFQSTLKEKIHVLLKNVDVLSEIETAFKEDKEVGNAVQAADMLNLDIWDIVYDRLVQNTENPVNWFDVVNRMTEKELDTVLGLARSTLRFDIVASGPTMETGIGTELDMHNALMFMVRELSRFPHQGWDLVEAAMHSPIISSRWAALHTIHMWIKEGSASSEEILDSLNTMWAQEPSEELREYIEHII